MRILLVTGIFPPDIGGPAGYVKRLADELARRNIETAVVTFGDDCSGCDGGYSVYRISRGGFLIVRYFLYFWQIWRLAKNYGALYCQGPVLSGLPCYLACLLRNKPYFVKVVGDFSWEYGRNNKIIEDTIDEFQKRKYYPLLLSVIRKAQSFVCKKSRGVIVPSNYLKLIVGQWGVAGEKIKVIYNAVEATPLTDIKDDLRKKIGWENNFVLLSAGRLVPWKGFDVLIDLMPGLLNENDKFRLIIAGDGPMENDLKKRIENLKLEKYIGLTGRLSKEEMFQYLKSADLFVLNTSYEGLSHIILEAMRVGCPVITTNIGGNPEVIKDGVNGLLVEPNNKKQFKDAIVKLSQNIDLRCRYIENGNKILKDKFNFQMMVDETIKYFHKHQSAN